MIEEVILEFVKDYGMLISFLGGFITGESVILFLSFLSANGIIPIWYILVFSTLGMYLSGFIPFTFGKFKFIRKLLKKRISRHEEKIEKMLMKYTKKNLFLTMLYAKFIYGASIPTLVYLGYKKTPYLKFAWEALLAEIIFVPIIVYIGFLSGKGFRFVMVIFDNIKIAVVSLIIFIILLFYIKKWINQKFIKRQEQLK